MVIQDTDRYGRTVGRVYVGNVDVNAEMVKQGAAGVYRKYPKDQGLARPVGACRRRRAHPPWECPAADLLFWRLICNVIGILLHTCCAATR